MSAKSHPSFLGKPLPGKINQQALGHDKQSSERLSREPMCGSWGAVALGYFHVAAVEASWGMEMSWSALGQVQSLLSLCCRRKIQRPWVGMGVVGRGEGRPVPWGEASVGLGEAVVCSLLGKKAGARHE